MSSENPGEEGDRGGAGPSVLAELLGRTSGGEPPTSVELAELLWLAGQMAGPDGALPAGESGAGRDAPGPRPPAEVPAAAGTPPATPPLDPPAEPRLPDDRVHLRLPSAGTGSDDRRSGPHTTLLAPAPPMLPHPLAIQRTLRPLKRRVPAPVGHELDEEATADRIARLGGAPRWWVPVLRPATERWLTLHLVYDAGPTMPVWRPLLRELHAALAQSGVFRTVELHQLTSDGTVRRPGSQESYGQGRTVTLLVSDCMGPQWRGGTAGTRWYRTLRRWADRMPVAVVQPLPERLWRTTALPATTARITAPWPAAPNSAYTIDSYATDGVADSGVLPLPVLEPSAPWLANWSSLVAATSGQPTGSVALLGPTAPPAPLDEQGRSDVEQLSPEELVLRFRSLASPEAFRLAGHLAVGRPELPVMRLVQAAIEQNPQPQRLAEVILSGLLRSTPGPPGSYAFRPGVRDLLLHTLPRTARSRTAELVARMGALIDDRAGVAAGDFPVLAPGRGDATAGGEPFAAVRVESVRRLGGTAPPPPGGLVLGRYRLLRRLGRGKQVMKAQDTRTDRTVAVHAYSSLGPEHHAQFLDAARALAVVMHPQVLAVHDYGIEGDIPYLVTEFVEGLTVAELTAEGEFGLPFALLAPLAQQVARGLKAVHERGITHGPLTPNALLVRPDGEVKITHFALGTAHERDEAKDLHGFGHLLRELATGVRPGELGCVPAEFRAFFDDALTPLTSSDPEAQRRGRDLFLSPSFAQVLEAATASRHSYRLLGPVRINQGDRALPLDSPREAALLCMLLLRRGRAVTYEELVQGLWGQHPPQRARRLLSTCAAALRGTLGPGVLAATADGYALHADPRCVDLNRCEDLIAVTKSLRDGGDPARARLAVREALGLWDGQPVDGVPGPAAEATRARLRALRLTLCVTRAELDLETGRFEQAAADLGELLRAHPQREDFRRLHILALKGQGRIAEALASYEAYEELQERQFSEPNATMLELYRGLRAAPERDRPTIVVEYLDPGDPDDQPHTHSTLGRTLAWLLSLSDMAPREYELLARDNGYLLITEPGSSVLTALNAVLRELPGALLELERPPRLSVTFWHSPAFAPADRPASPLAERTAEVGAFQDIVVVLSPVLHEELMSGATAVDPARFLPLHGERSGPPLAWYCALDLPERVPEPDPVPRDLVRGPFTTRDLTRLRVQEQGRVAVVHTAPDNSLVLLDLNRPLGKRPPRSLISYYEVDLTTHGAVHELRLPHSGRGAFAATAELSWHVEDPVAFVLGETADVSGQLLDHLVREAGRITRRYPLQRAGAAQRAVHDGLRRWPVPGLSVGCSVRLRQGAPPSQVPPPGPVERPVRRGSEAGESSPASVLDDAECVLLGFHGTLTRLWGGVERDRANHELSALLVELRRPDEALSGVPLLAGGAPAAPLEGYANPHDLLRALAGHSLAPELRRELDRLEARAVPSASPIPYADPLVRALAATGRGPAVVADTSPRVVLSYLESRGLTDSVTGGVHGRSDDLTLLMPNPDCLHRALDALGVAAPQAVLIGSTIAELTAANAIGLPFIGLARQVAVERRLTRAGCERIVTSLEPVLDAFRTA